MTLGVAGVGVTSTEVHGGNRSSAPVPQNAEDAPFKAVLHRAKSESSRVSGSGHQVVPAKTPLSGTQAAEAIREAYVAVTGQQPTRGTLAILTSHWALETGQGKSMYNFNFAGIKGRGPEGMTAVMNTREGHGQSAVHIRDGFRAYTSAEAGAKDYIALLQRKYGSALDAAVAEQPGRFAEQLKAGGYYTGDPELYAKGVTQLANRAMAQGFDALGTSSGALQNQPQALPSYFATSPSDFFVDSPYRSEWGADLLDNLGVATNGMFEPSSASVEALRDEMSRTALLIAAKRGAV